jgi:hypothetical protein
MIRKKIIMYLRKSRTDNQFESVTEVLQRHEQILQDYCMRTFGEPIPQSNIYREVVSGETISDRPVMMKLLDDIEKGDIDAVIVIEPQRLTRGSFGDIDRIVNSFLYTDTKIITPTKHFDLSDKFDRKYFEQELLRGNDYLEYVKEILSRGRKRSVEDGLYIGSVAVFGYDRVKLPKKGFTLVPNADAESVRYIFEKFNEGLGTSQLATHLNQIGIKSKKNSIWSVTMVRHILENKIYIGYLTYGKRKRIKQMKNGEITKARVVADDYVEIKGIHEPIISEEVFEKAQSLLAIKSKPVRIDYTLKNPLAGLIKCKYCDRTLARRTINGKVYLYCPTLGCANVSASLSEIEERIISTLTKELENYKTYIDNYEEEIKTTASITIKQVRKIDKELTALKQDLRNALIKYNRGAITEEEYIFLREYTLEEESRLKVQKNELESIVATEELERKRKAIPILKNCINEYHSLSIADKNAVLQTIIDKVIYEKKTGGRWKSEKEKAFTLEFFLRI